MLILKKQRQRQNTDSPDQPTVADQIRHEATLTTQQERLGYVAARAGLYRRLKAGRAAALRNLPAAAAAACA